MKFSLPKPTEGNETDLWKEKIIKVSRLKNSKRSIFRLIS